MESIKEIKELAFKGKESLFEELYILHTNKGEVLGKINNTGTLREPMVITISGSPRTGKTTCLSYLYDFFKKGGFKIVYLSEPATTIFETFKSDKELEKAISNRIEFNRMTREYAIGKIGNIVSENNVDIILCDRGIYDTYIWEQMYYDQGLISKEDYDKSIQQLYSQKPFSNTMLFGLQCNAETSVCRDYLNSITLDPRRITTVENTSKFNSAMNKCKIYFEDIIDVCQYLDSEELDTVHLSMCMASQILDFMKERYLEEKARKLEGEGNVC